MKKNIVFKSILIALCLICYQLINSTNVIAYDIPFIKSNKSSAILKIDDPILAPGKSFSKKFKIQNNLDYKNKLEAIYLENFIINSSNEEQYNQFVENVNLELIHDNNTIFKEYLGNIIENDGKLIFDDNKSILFEKDETKEFSLVVSMNWDADTRVAGLTSNFDIYFMCSEVYVSSSTKKYNSPGRNKRDEKPVLTLVGENAIEINLGEEYIDEGATAEDKEDGDITSKIEVRVNGILNGKVDTKVEGKYMITYNVTDSEGNSADEIKREVKVINKLVDNKPVITLIGKEKIEISKGEEYVDMGATAYDKEDGDITSKIQIRVNGISNAKIDTEIKGKYIITYNVIDSDGNIADEIKREVNVNEVNDPEKPIENSKPIITLIGEEKIEIFEDEEYVDMGAKAFDEEDGDISEEIIVKVNGVVGEVDIKVPGEYIITYNVSDSSGNKANEVRRTVIVNEVVEIIDELPKTGERDPLIFYIIGLGLVAIGLFVRRKHLTK